METVYQKRVKLYHHKWLGSDSHKNDVLFIYDDLLHRTMFVVEHEEEANRKKRENSSGRTFHKSQASNALKKRIMRNVCKVNQQERSKLFKFMQNYNEAKPISPTIQSIENGNGILAKETATASVDEKKNKL